MSKILIDIVSDMAVVLPAMEEGFAKDQLYHSISRAVANSSLNDKFKRSLQGELFTAFSKSPYDHVPSVPGSYGVSYVVDRGDLMGCPTLHRQLDSDVLDYLEGRT